MANHQCQPQKLVIAFHVGTVHSRIAYAALDSEGNKGAHGQVVVPTGTGKYDEQTSGASVNTAHSKTTRLNNVGYKARCLKSFKFHLLPTSTANAAVMRQRHPLPCGKSTVNIFADILTALNKYALDYIKHRHPSLGIAKDLDSTVFVLTSPAVEAFPILHDAAIRAGIVPDTPSGRKRLHLVSEIEAASGFFSFSNSDSFEEKEGVILANVGVDTTSFQTFQISVSPDGLPGLNKPLSATKVYVEGTQMITERFRTHITQFLGGSRYGSSVIDTLVDEFDRETAREYRHFHGFEYIKFGEEIEDDAEYDIVWGHLVLRGTEIARFFEPTISAIVRGVLEQLNSVSKVHVCSIILLGGIFYNHWVYTRVKSTLEALGLECRRLSRSDNMDTVSLGAIEWYLSRSPENRVSKHHYGIQIPIPYDSWDRDHVSRKWLAYTGFDGESWLKHSFCVILPKGESNHKVKEYRKHFSISARRRNSLEVIRVNILRNRNSICPKWVEGILIGDNGFEIAKTFEANTCSHSTSLQPRKSPFKTCKGYSYYTIEYDVILRFGPDEFSAQAVWRENGREKSTGIYAIDDSNS